MNSGVAEATKPRTAAVPNTANTTDLCPHNSQGARVKGGVVNSLTGRHSEDALSWILDLQDPDSHPVV